MEHPIVIHSFLFSPSPSFLVALKTSLSPVRLFGRMKTVGGGGDGCDDGKSVFSPSSFGLQRGERGGEGKKILTAETKRRRGRIEGRRTEGGRERG